MENISLSQLFTYPIKSTTGIRLAQSKVNALGLPYDRHWAVCDAKGQALTGRQHPKLLGLHPAINGEHLEIHAGTSASTKVPLYSNGSTTNLQIFGKEASGVPVPRETDEWISDYLGLSCRLLFMSRSSGRSVPLNYGGKPTDAISYADNAPLLLLSEASLADLNTRLEKPVGIPNFRPNLVVKGGRAYAEDHWKSIRIGDCQFEVLQACRRCVFTTIDPQTHQKDKNREPLRTLATYREVGRGKVTFGMYLIPRKTGTLRLGDEVIPIL